MLQWNVQSMLIVVCAVLFSTPMPNPTNKHKQNKTNTTYIHIHMHKHNHTTHTCIRIYNHIHIDSRLFTFYTHTCNTTHDRLQQQAIQITTIMTIFIQSRTTHNHRIHSCHHHSIFSLSLLSLLSLLLLLSSSSSSFLLVSGGRIISYTDTECIQSDPAASIEAQFIPGTCYTAGQGSVITQCNPTNTSVPSFTWKYSSSDSSCTHVSGISGMADGTCYAVRVGAIGSMRIFCSQAIRNINNNSILIAIVVGICCMITSMMIWF